MIDHKNSAHSAVHDNPFPPTGGRFGGTLMDRLITVMALAVTAFLYTSTALAGPPEFNLGGSAEGEVTVSTEDETAPADTPTDTADSAPTDDGSSGDGEEATSEAGLYMEMSHFDAGRQGIRAYNAFTTEPELAALADATADNLRSVSRPNAAKSKQAKASAEMAHSRTIDNTAMTTRLLYSLTGPEAYDISDFREWAAQKGCTDDVEAEGCKAYLDLLRADANARIEKVETAPGKAHAQAILALADNSLDPVVKIMLLHTAPSLLPEEHWSDIWPKPEPPPEPPPAVDTIDDVDDSDYTAHEVLTRDKMAGRDPSDGRSWPNDDPNFEFNEDSMKGLEGMEGFVYEKDFEGPPHHGEISDVDDTGFKVGDRRFTYEEFNSGDKILTTAPISQSATSNEGLSIHGEVDLMAQLRRNTTAAFVAKGVLKVRWTFAKPVSIGLGVGVLGIASGGIPKGDLQYTDYFPARRRTTGIATVELAFTPAISKSGNVRWEVAAEGGPTFNGGGMGQVYTGPQGCHGKKKVKFCWSVGATAGYLDFGGPTGERVDPGNPNSPEPGDAVGAVIGGRGRIGIGF